MKVTTKPVCKVGWEGQTLHYLVTAEGADEVRVPADAGEAMEVRITDQRPVAGGVEADLEVKVLDSTPY